MKLKTGYSDLTPDDAVDLGGKVKTNMTGKPVWSGLNTLLTQLPLDIAAVVAAASATGPSASTQLELATGKLADTIGAIADGANRTAGVTEVDLASTGLPLVKQKTQLTEPPPAPLNTQLRHGQMPGEVLGTVDPPPGGNIRSYEGQWALSADGPYSEIQTFPNSRRMRFTGLARGKDTWFRFRARNTVGAGPWSDPATIMVT